MDPRTNLRKRLFNETTIVNKQFEEDSKLRLQHFKDSIPSMITKVYVKELIQTAEMVIPDKSKNFFCVICQNHIIEPRECMECHHLCCLICMSDFIEAEKKSNGQNNN